MTVENENPAKGGKMINVGVSAKKKENKINVKNIVWNLSTCSYENIEHLTNATDSLVITCEGIINSWANVSPYFHKKARYKMDCYILYAVLLVIILVLKIVVFCYHCVKHRSKQKKNIGALTM